MKPNPAVGQRLFSLNVGNAARRCDPRLTPVVVIKVGRKYFTTSREEFLDSPHTHTDYHLGTWREKTQFCEDSRLYTSEQEWADEKEMSFTCELIERAFKHGRNLKNLSLDDLRKIKALLK